MNHSNMGVRKSGMKSFPVLSDALSIRKKEMPHPSELPDFSQVINAKPKE